MKNVAHDLSELRKILQRFETVFVCLFVSVLARAKRPICQLVLVSEEHKFAICVYALTLNTSIKEI